MTWIRRQKEEAKERGNQSISQSFHDLYATVSQCNLIKLSLPFQQSTLPCHDATFTHPANITKLLPFHEKASMLSPAPSNTKARMSFLYYISPEATPTDVMLTEILQVGRLKE